MENAVVRCALLALKMAEERFIYGLRQVPEERLTWTPGGVAGSPLQVAGRFAGFLRRRAVILRTRSIPPRPEPGPGPASLAEAETDVRAALAEMRELISGLTAADLETGVPQPWGATSRVEEFVSMVGFMCGYFQGQINHLQLAWGDRDPNMPPEWRTG